MVATDPCAVSTLGCESKCVYMCNIILSHALVEPPNHHHMLLVISQIHVRYLRVHLVPLKPPGAQVQGHLHATLRVKYNNMIRYRVKLPQILKHNFLERF